MKEIEKLEEELLTAIQKSDISKLDEMLHENLLFIGLETYRFLK